jgi:SAM-dependent methyltransferase
VAGEAEFFDLDELSKATRLGDWMFSQFRGLVRGRVAEVGAGIGTFSSRLLPHSDELCLIEPDGRGADELRRRFGADPKVTIVQDEVPGSALLGAGGFDMVLAQNVLEHIADDAAAVQEMADAVVPGGSLCLLVPAHPRLYGSLDRAYGHHRRYTRTRLRELVEDAGLDVRSLYSFNLLGVAGWLVKRHGREPRLDARSLRAYEALVRFWRPLEERLRPPVGLSLVAKTVKPG